MNYISIIIPGDALVLPAEDGGALAGILSRAIVYNRDWDGAYTPMLDGKKQAARFSIEFVSVEQFAAIPERTEALQTELDNAKKDWMKEYTKRISAETALATLKHDLAARGITIEDETKEAS